MFSAIKGISVLYKFSYLVLSCSMRMGNIVFYNVVDFLNSKRIYLKLVLITSSSQEHQKNVFLLSTVVPFYVSIIKDRFALPKKLFDHKS